jgi:hypothetical protein
MVFLNGGGSHLLEEWLSALPRDVDLAEADQECVDHLAGLSSLADAEWLSMLSKVAHHKRPKLVPLFDRAIVDWYRPVTGRRGTAAWPSLVKAIKADLSVLGNRQFLFDMGLELAQAAPGPVPSDLRLLDIAIWMDGRRG